MRTVAIAAALMFLGGCQAEQASNPQQQVSNMASTGDAEMDRKIAEAKAAFEKLSPAEKAELAKRGEAAATTLPLTLAEAASLPVAPAGKPATTLGALAPAGKPTVIAAWASWCIPCKFEARHLAELQRQYGPDALNIVYLNIGDPKVEAEKAPQFLKDAGAEALGLTMFSQDGFKTLTRLDQVSVPRVLPYDRQGKPAPPITGAAISMEDDKSTGDARVEKAVKAITA